MSSFKNDGFSKDCHTLKIGSLGKNPNIEEVNDDGMVPNLILLHIKTLIKKECLNLACMVKNQSPWKNLFNRISCATHFSSWWLYFYNSSILVFINLNSFMN